jgi:hypothetical protein
MRSESQSQSGPQSSSVMDVSSEDELGVSDRHNYSMNNDDSPLI